MSYKRHMKRYAKLIPQATIIQQLVSEKGYRENDVKVFMKDLNEIVIENLSCGNSVRLLPGLFIEVMLHPGQKYWSFKEQKNVELAPYPTLMCRITGALKDKVYKSEEELLEDEEAVEEDRYGYDD